MLRTSHIIIFDFIAVILFGEEFKLWNSSLSNYCHISLLPHWLPYWSSGVWTFWEFLRDVDIQRSCISKKSVSSIFITVIVRSQKAPQLFASKLCSPFPASAHSGGRVELFSCQVGPFQNAQVRFTGALSRKLNVLYENHVVRCLFDKKWHSWNWLYSIFRWLVVIILTYHILVHFKVTIEIRLGNFEIIG